jgi:hypothetical protein
MHCSGGEGAEVEEDGKRKGDSHRDPLEGSYPEALAGGFDGMGDVLDAVRL